MRIKEAARKTGLTEKAIRYYENRGLVLPDTEERNGRTWRDYTEDHIRLLEAVATLRRAQFHVEEIDAILSDPHSIPEVLDEVSRRVEEAYETLGKLRSELKRESVKSAPDALTLAEELKETVKPLPLPPQDLKFNFKAQDRILAEERSRVDGAPAGRFRFGWMPLYRGQDEAKYRQIQQQLTTYGVEFRALSFTSGNRLAAQGLVNAATPAYTQKAQVSTAGLQAKMLSSEEMDSYTIEVRKRDAEKARTALRSIG
jgi:DNA-binding transcriptional MerR regulator